MDENNQMLSLVDRQKLNATGIKAVDSFDNDNVVLSTLQGCLTVSGNDLKITNLNLDQQQIEISGIIESMSYSQDKAERTMRAKGKSFVGRLLK